MNFIKLQTFIISILLIFSEGVFCDNFLTAARMSDSDKATRFVFEFKNNVTYKVIELVEPTLHELISYISTIEKVGLLTWPEWPS